MSRTERVVERVKTALIILLALCALLLGWRTGIFGELSKYFPLFGNVGGLGRGPSGSAELDRVVAKEAARPLAIVITDENGDHYAVKYDVEARNSLYDRTSNIFTEALGSAAQPAAVDEAEWRQALSGQGIYYEYITPVKLYVLNGWLDAHMQEQRYDASLRRICVAFGENKSRIYYQDAEDGLFYGADTESTAGKAQELSSFSANGVFFAFETGNAIYNKAPYSLLMPDVLHPYARAGAAGVDEELLRIVQEAAGHGNDSSTVRDDGYGNLWCIGTQFNIAVDALGTVTYWRTHGLPDSADASRISESELIERARILVAETIGSFCGAAEVFFEALEYNEEGLCTVYFGYYLSGGRVYLFNDGYAAKLTFRESIAAIIELNFRSFALSEEYAELLPEWQALAAASGEFILSYADPGVEVLQPMWVHYEV